MAKGKSNGEMKFRATVGGQSTLKPLGKNDGPRVGVKVTLETLARNVDLNRLAEWQEGMELDVLLVPVQGSLPLENAE